MGSVGIFDDVQRTALGDHRSAAISALWPEIDNIIRCFDDFQIVLDDDHGVPVIHNGLHDIDELLNIEKMEPRGRFIQNIEGSALGWFDQFFGYFYALRFSSGKWEILGVAS